MAGELGVSSKPALSAFSCVYTLQFISTYDHIRVVNNHCFDVSVHLF